MKKALSLALGAALSLSLAAPALADGAVLSFRSMKVDGEDVMPEAYSIDGSDYFKLRSIALLLSGTGSQFEVDYDSDAKTVVVTTGAAYTPTGGELASGADFFGSAVPTSQTIRIDGEAVEGLTVYNIGGSNFFKLEDLSERLGFDVAYDAETAAVLVTSRAAGTEASAEDETAAGTETSDGAKAIYARSKETHLLNGEESSTIVYSNFDAQGNPGKTEETDGDRVYVTTITYTYDDAGNKVREVRTSANENESATVYEYDSEGRLVRDTITGADGDAVIETVYEYDADGFKVKETIRMAGSPDTVKTYENNEQGDPVKTVLTRDGEELYAAAYTYEYDEDGRMVRRSSEGAVVDSVDTFEYDANGNLVKTVSAVEDEEFVTVYEYTGINAGVRG